jgi:hypothetical protein
MRSRLSIRSLRHLAKYICRRRHRRQGIRGDPSELAKPKRPFCCAINHVGDLHVPELSNTLRLPDQVGARGAKFVAAPHTGPIVRCSPVSVAILQERSCAGLSFKSLDQLPQRTAIRNVVEAISSQVHLPAQLGEGRLPNHARCRAQPCHTAEGAISAENPWARPNTMHRNSEKLCPAPPVSSHRLVITDEGEYSRNLFVLESQK